ncbi:hypothetical protein QFZ35_003854 [Arthrobacter ulcerisalmonis]|nr:hypothetical protein [Arthrobacter ulcerisalmonis]
MLSAGPAVKGRNAHTAALTRVLAGPNALKIGDRPAHIATSREAGHWEGELFMGKGNRSAIVTLVERSSRLLVAFVLCPGNRSDNMRDQLIEALGVLPAPLRRTLTWDRGSELGKHAEVTAVLGALVYFCDRPALGNVHRTRTPMWLDGRVSTPPISQGPADGQNQGQKSGLFSSGQPRLPAPFATDAAAPSPPCPYGL